MARKRRLTPEERELWSRVAATTEARRDRHGPTRTEEEAPHQGARPPIPEVPEPRPLPPKADLSKLRIGAKPGKPSARHLPAPSISEHLASQPLRMDHKAHKTMTRGKMEPDARLDLHGMTLAEAHPELIRFVLRAQDHGHRLVLVITGKGKQKDEGWIMPERLGVLRHQVPHWLRQAPLGPVVLQITPAHQKHGGQGAYYVYLRRLR